MNGQIELDAKKDLGLTEITKVGENDHGYWFAIGLLAGRWVGFAVSSEPLTDGRTAMFFLPGIAESYQLGLLDRDTTIKMVGAIAQAPEQGYGGIARWFVPEELQGKPEDYRCFHCEQIGCAGDCE